MLRVTGSGKFPFTKGYLKKLVTATDMAASLHIYGEMGVEALIQATPVDSGVTAQDWKYEITKHKHGPGIKWYNTNVVGGTPVIILLQYGHGTGTGGYVQGHDFINPAMQPIFDRIRLDVWEKVSTR